MPRFTIAKRFTFSASHILEGLPEGHQCGRLHGHNYGVRVILESETLDELGFVIDFGDLADFKRYLDGNLDHRHLNDVLSFNPTCESLAFHLYGVAKKMLPQVVAVEVSETEATWARYSE